MTNTLEGEGKEIDLAVSRGSGGGIEFLPSMLQPWKEWRLWRFASGQAVTQKAN